MAKTIGGGDKTDFDETRRLLYMAKLASRTKRYNLAGTLTNALVHHHAVDDLDADQVADHVVAVLEGGEGEEAGRAFLWEQISRITAELGD
jgi:hypothetical protein